MQKGGSQVRARVNIMQALSLDQYPYGIRTWRTHLWHNHYNIIKTNIKLIIFITSTVLNNHYNSLWYIFCDLKLYFSYKNLVYIL